MVQDNLPLADMERQKLVEDTILIVVVVGPSTVMPGVHLTVELIERDSLQVYGYWYNV